MPNPLRADPTRTGPLRRRYVAGVDGRVSALRRAVRRVVVTDDAFGLRGGLVANAENWSFESDPQKVESFRRWLQEQIDAGLLAVEGLHAAPWANKFIFSAYKEGLLRAFRDTKPKALAKSADFHSGQLTQFLQGTFSAPITTQRLELLYTRNFEKLRGVTTDMASKMSATLADGLAHGHNPTRIASSLVKNVDGLNRRRATLIARTEIIYAFAEGQLDAFEALGVEKLGVLVELATAGDDRVCPICLDLEGQEFTIAEARGVIPVHPDCRCCWVPSTSGIFRAVRRRRAA